MGSDWKMKIWTNDRSNNGKLSPRSTQCTPLHRSQCSKFSSKIAEIFANKPLSGPRRKAPRPEWGAWWKCCERVKYTAPSRRAMRRYVVFPYYFYERYFPFWTMKKFTDENCANCMKDADSMLPCFSSKCVPGRSPKSGVVVRWKYVAILILSSMLTIFDRLLKSLFGNLRL